MKSSRLWSLPPLQEIYRQFRVDPEFGLTEEEAGRRLNKWGYNTIQEKKQKGMAEIFLDQFRDFMVLVLLGATFISGMLKEYSDALTILIIVFLNAILGFVQEYRAERSFAALKSLTAPQGKVLRGKVIKEIPAEEVVPGDIVYIQAGDRICADLRLVGADALMVDESPLTGESVAVEKEPVLLNQIPSSPGDAGNMVFSGTLVLNGSGRGIAVATGMETEMGRIASLMQETEVSSTPLQRRLARLGKILVTSCLFFCLIVVVLGLWRGEELYRMLMAGISLAVAAIPEGLPAIVTISLALGVQRMVRQRAIVRRLPAVETLGCTTVICSDKTGTITQNKMAVKSIYANGSYWETGGEGHDKKILLNRGKKDAVSTIDPHLYKTLLIGVLCNNAAPYPHNGRSNRMNRKEAERRIQGNPTEAALLECAAQANIWKDVLEKKYSRIKEHPFSSSRKCMSVVCQGGDGLSVFVKGAPERILANSAYIYEDGKVKPLQLSDRNRIAKQVELMASGALRTLAVAYRPLQSYSATSNADELEKDLIFVGVFGMIDPPRPAVFKAIQKCQKAGVRVAMITGDHRNTAVAIAKQIGIFNYGAEVVTGTELDQMSDKELSRRIEKINVFARVNPEHKLRIVRCLKAGGHIVAMTGDGVNDAPAVKEADIGIAMGMAGTEVTKEAASLVLADDNFRTIVAAVEEGRNIYDNIRKFIRFLLGCNLGEILTMFLAMFWGLPLPLRPIQILWVNLVTDGLPAMALGVDPAEKNVMSRPPRLPNESIFSRGLWKKIVSRGSVIGITTITIFALAYNNSSDLIYAQTMALSTLILTQLLHVFECRSEYLAVWETGFTGNLMLLGAVIFSFLLLLAIIYLPFLREIFQTYPLGVKEWILIFSASSVPYFFSLIMWWSGKLTG
ncbi:MAG: calcium-translocating P-type ATPase, SERCA-type [Firmicutes bacterium]|jgi:Ca2+-transporting ATPase|nr:calcium-translocating P-type ATPase, SERCA-type [Bacillota bacterium]